MNYALWVYLLSSVAPKKSKNWSSKLPPLAWLIHPRPLHELQAYDGALFQGPGETKTVALPYSYLLG